MAIIRTGSGKSIYNGQKIFVAEGTLATTTVLDVAAFLGTNGNNGYIRNDGAGDFTVEIAHAAPGGTPSYANSTPFTIKSGESYSLLGMDVAFIRLGYSASANYRVQCS